jgi:hypothetical protein
VLRLTVTRIDGQDIAQRLLGSLMIAFFEQRPALE